MTHNSNVPYGRQWIDESDIAAVTRVLSGDWLTTGPAVDAFEQALAKVAAVDRAIVVNSGSAALHVAYFAARAVSLPIFPAMDDCDIERVIETVEACAEELL